ncbi:hypothetical protein IMZ48_07005 [Candidatus Bathyarchaeota archaeon]|nr:hypothetical protein [Candidatus Bathyarchaeota archaeon]
MIASPRRALAPLDANKPAPSPMNTPMKKLSGLLPRPAPHASPLKQRKRSLEVEERVVKRSCTGASPLSTSVCPFPVCLVCPPCCFCCFVSCLERRGTNGLQARDSISPDASSIFEDSTRTTSVLDADNTQITASVFEDNTRTAPVLEDNTRTTASVVEDNTRSTALVPKDNTRATAPVPEGNTRTTSVLEDNTRSAASVSKDNTRTVAPVLEDNTRATVSVLEDTTRTVPSLEDQQRAKARKVRSLPSPPCPSPPISLLPNNTQRHMRAETNIYRWLATSSPASV